MCTLLWRIFKQILKHVWIYSLADLNIGHCVDMESFDEKYASIFVFDGTFNMFYSYMFYLSLIKRCVHIWGIHVTIFASQGFLIRTASQKNPWPSELSKSRVCLRHVMSQLIYSLTNENVRTSSDNNGGLHGYRDDKNKFEIADFRVIAGTPFFSE